MVIRPGRQGRIRGDTQPYEGAPMSETPLESPAEDAAEQRQEVYPGGPRSSPVEETSR